VDDARLERERQEEEAADAMAEAAKLEAERREVCCIS
jgi:hypothetical protein